LPNVIDTLVPGEKEVVRAELHWQALLGPAVVALAGFVGALVLAIKSHSFSGAQANLGYFSAALLLVTCGIPLGIQFAILQTSEFVLTNRRLIVSRGLLGRSTIEVLLTKVTGVDVEQSLFGRIGDFGTVAIIGFAGAQEVLQNIRAPHEFRRQVEVELAGRRRP
jgi:uncharacterized membrane protein YdbT with pleckstrin-like domain